MLQRALDEANARRDRALRILGTRELSSVLQEARSRGKRVVHCHGVFDVLHAGHIRYFEEAKSMGDVLVVTLTPDQFVNKGPHRPAFTGTVRAEVIAALSVVDYVAINEWPTAVEAIRLLRPDVYVKGPDYADRSKDVTGGILLEEEAVRSVGGELRFTTGQTFSSSKLVNEHIPLFAPEVKRWLDDFRSRHSSDEVKGYLDALSSLDVLVAGEVILDEYVYGAALGTSAKEPILALKHTSSETLAGGSAAVANHLAGFVRQVELVTYVGDADPRCDFLKSALLPNVRPSFIRKTGSPTIVKRRFVDSYSLVKLLEVYEMNDQPLSGPEEDNLCAALERCGDTHLAVVADFGHGLMTRRARSLISERARFLAINTQINAANTGFHTLSKYQRADYVCVHEGEVRLDTRDRWDPLQPLVEDVATRLGCRGVMITQGKHGSLLYRKGEGFISCPSLAIRVVDRLGAGDAVLAITSACAAQNVPADVCGFLANVIGAQAVGILGNRTAIDKVSVMKTVESLLK